MAVTVHAPVEGFTGQVAGVVFDNGVAQVGRLTAAQRAYFARHGYGINRPAIPVTSVPAGTGAPLQVQVGTRLADAAQTGARVTVTVDGQVVWDSIEDPADAAALVGDLTPTGPVTDLPQVEPVAVEPEPGPVRKPSVRDDKAAWVTWAVANGADQSDAEAMTKAQLIDTYSSKEGS